MKIFFLSSYFLIFSFLISSEENESLEILYNKIEVLEQEIKELRNILYDEAANQTIKNEMGKVREMLGVPGAYQRAADDYIKYIVKISGPETS